MKRVYYHVVYAGARRWHLLDVELTHLAKYHWIEFEPDLPFGFGIAFSRLMKGL